MSRRTAGFTFIELLLVLLLGAIVTAAVYQTLVGQSQASRHLGAKITTQQTNRLGLEVLAAELREISTMGGDLFMASPDSIRFRAYRAVGIVCARDNNLKRIDVALLGQVDFARYDSLVVFADRVRDISTDDVWYTSVVAQNPAAIFPCNFVFQSLFPGQYRRLTLPVGAPVRLDSVWVGAPLRSFHHVTYGHYQVAGEWVLARHWQDPQSGTVNTAPLLGPLAPPARQGLVFRFFDADGQQINPTSAAERAQVAIVELVVRGSTPGSVTGSTITDSLVTRVHLRGNRRL